MEINQLNISRVLSFASTENSLSLHYLDLQEKRLKLYHYWVDRELGVFLVMDSHKGLKLLHHDGKTLVVQGAARIGFRIGEITEEGSVSFSEQASSLDHLIGRRKLITATVHQPGQLFLFFRGTRRQPQHLLVLYDLKTGELTYHQQVANSDYRQHLYASFQSKILRFDQQTGAVDIVDLQSLQSLRPIRSGHAKVNHQAPDKQPMFKQYVMAVHPSAAGLQLEYSDHSLGPNASAKERMKVLYLDKQFKASFQDAFKIEVGNKGRFSLPFPRGSLRFEAKP